MGTNIYPNLDSNIQSPMLHVQANDNPCALSKYTSVALGIIAAGGVAFALFTNIPILFVAMSVLALDGVIFLANYLFLQKLGIQTPPITSSPMTNLSDPISMGPVNPEIYRTLSVNRTVLNRTPQSLDPDLITRIANDATPPVMLYTSNDVGTSELLAQFDGVFSGMGENEILYNDEGRDITLGAARNTIKENFLGFIKNEINGLSQYQRLVAEDLQVFLKGIIFELRKTEIPIEKKKEQLINLANAARHCVPRRHTEASRVYRELSNQMETVEDILLGYMQTLKEDLFVNFYSLSRESVMTLNYIRLTVGLELGLDRNPVNLQDVYINMHDARSPENPTNGHVTSEQFLEVFNRIYTPANILNHMKTRLNNRIIRDAEFTRNISQFISNQLVLEEQQGHITSEDLTETYPEPYQVSSTYQLTDLGVKFLLVHFGYLNDSQERGHLVRVIHAAS